MRLAGLIAVLLLSGTASSAAAPHPGTLDRSFSGDGRVATRVAGGTPVVAGLHPLRGGDTLLVGAVGARRLVLIRYTGDGSLGATATHDFPEGVLPSDTMLDAAGRLVVAATLGGYAEHVAAVLRFDASGRLDPTFGTGGITRISFGSLAGADADQLAPAPDGGILLAGQAWNSDRGSLALAQLDATGRVIRTSVPLAAKDGGDRWDAGGVMFTADGGLLAALTLGGYRGTSSAVLLGLLPDWSPDPRLRDWGPGLWARSGDDASSFNWAGHQRSTGRLVLGGGATHPANGEVAYRLAATKGTPPRIVWERLFDPAFYTATFDRSDRILLGGSYAYETRPPGRVYDGHPRAHMLVTRLRPGGRVDSCFGDGGTVLIRFPNRNVVLGALAADARGRVLLAGTPGFAYKGDQRFQVARLRGGSCPRR